MTAAETELEQLERAMEQAWRDLTRIEQRINPRDPAQVAEAERAYDRYLAALAAFMACAAARTRDLDPDLDLDIPTKQAV